MIGFEYFFRCLICKKSHRLRFVEEGFEKLEEELNMVNYMKKIKVLGTTMQ
jgi:hypothetical protein